MQITEGRWFLHEHPAGASSWGPEAIKKIEAETGVKIRTADQCMYGLKTWGEDRSRRDRFARKRTKFMTNSEELAEELSLRCNMKHEHQELTGQRAKEAAKYPEELCEAICRGLVKQIMCQEAKLKYLMAVRAEDEVEEESDEDGVRKNIHEGGTDGMDLGAWDDVSGASLDPKEVVKARLKEVGYVRDKRVWTKISRKEAIRRGIKIVGDEVD